MGQMCPPTTTTSTTTISTTTTTSTTSTTTTTTTTSTTTLDEHTDKIQFTVPPATIRVGDEISNGKWEIVRSIDQNAGDMGNGFTLRGLLPVPPSSPTQKLKLRNTRRSFKSLNHQCGLRYKKLRNKFRHRNYCHIFICHIYN